MEYLEKGVPVSRPAEVNLRNNHVQYIVTWYVPLCHQTTLLRHTAAMPSLIPRTRLTRAQVRSFSRHLHHVLLGRAQAAI
jgi:hypothetical protein